MQDRDLAVDGVEHVEAGVTLTGLVAVRVEVVQRAVLGELRVHHVARKTEHHRLARLGVDADQDDGVGADAGATHSPVAAEQQDVDAVLARPRVLDRHVTRRRGAAHVVG